METTYDVRVWGIQTRHKLDDNGRKVPQRYVVRWMAGGQRFDQTYKIRAQADSFRSELMTAARNGEPFDVRQGLPRTMLRTAARQMTWIEFARAYVDLKWDDSAPKSRKSTADNLVAITSALLAVGPARRNSSCSAPRCDASSTSPSAAGRCRKGSVTQHGGSRIRPLQSPTCRTRQRSARCWPRWTANATVSGAHPIRFGCGERRCGTRSTTPLNCRCWRRTPSRRSRRVGTGQCYGRSTVDPWPTRCRRGRSYSLCVRSTRGWWRSSRSSTTRPYGPRRP
jgi:hypothetical protein